VFRVGDADAKQLAEGFAGFEAADISKLEKGQAICRIERSDHDFNLSVIPSAYPSEDQARDTRTAVIARSREQFATSRVEIEALLRQQLTVTPKQEKSKPANPVASPPPVEPKVVEPAPVAEIPRPAEVPPAPKSAIAVEPSAPPKETVTVSEEKKAVMGRGGPQHQDIQQRLREGAQALGFHVTVEKQTEQGSVDLLLKRGGQTVACEITVTTSVTHEVGNARKCLESEYQHVVLISTEESRLEKLKQATSSLATAHPNRLQYFTPEQFLVWLGTLPAEAAAPEIPPGERNIRGYKVRSKGSALTDEERQSKESTALKIIGDVIKPKKTRS